MEQNNSNNLWRVLIGIGVLGAIFWWQLRPGSTPVSNVDAPSISRAGSSNGAVIRSSRPNPPASSPPASFADLVRDLVIPGSPPPRAEGLARVRSVLDGSTPSQSATEIRRFLDSHTDAPTGLGFKVGGQGFLTEAPTMRTYLLDYLGRIDPAAAAEYARVILNSKDSPDEWAVALRSLAKGDSTPAGRELLEQKTGELLQHKPWQDGPSTGYLESFDVAVYVGGTKLVPVLGDLLRPKDNPAVSHAAYLALDRLVISNPGELLPALLDRPEMMEGREQTRADYFARADVRDPGQRGSIEKYLLDPKRSAAELQQFAGVFPNANYMVSQNLLTPVATPDSSSLVSRDAASLAAVEAWLADPRFAALRSQLERMRLRVGEFVRQARDASSPAPK